LRDETFSNRLRLLKQIATAASAAQLSPSGLGATASSVAVTVAPAETAPTTPSPAPPAGYQSLSPDEPAFAEALVNIMCPADHLTPDGVECGLAIFIDRQLAGGFGQGTAKGTDVVVLERGPDRRNAAEAKLPYQRDELRWDIHAGRGQDWSVETYTVRHSRRDEALPARRLGAFLPGEGMGGAGNHWNGYTWRWSEYDPTLCTRFETRYGKDAVPADLLIQDCGGGISANLTNGRPIGARRVPPGTPRWGTQWKEANAAWYAHSFSMQIQGSSYPHCENYLDLDPVYQDAHGQPPGADYLRLARERHADVRVLYERMEDVTKAMDATVLGPATPRKSPFDTRFYQSTHVTGGTPMGVDPKTSVVSQHLQHWDA
jgi:choline dehydrogenase-like flavoprotein